MGKIALKHKEYHGTLGDRERQVQRETGGRTKWWRKRERNLLGPESALHHSNIESRREGRRREGVMTGHPSSTQQHFDPWLTLAQVQICLGLIL